jgi:hypothetical protein
MNYLMVLLNMLFFGVVHEPTNNEPFCEPNNDLSYDSLKLSFTNQLMNYRINIFLNKLMYRRLSLLMNQLISLRMKQLSNQQMRSVAGQDTDQLMVIKHCFL